MKDKKDLLILFIIGLTVQITLSKFTIFRENFHNYIYISFSLVLILYGIFLRYIIKKLNIKNIILTILLATFLLNIIGFIDFYIYPMLGGSTGQMYGLIFIYGFFPISTILGIIYGIYVYKLKLNS